MANYTAKAQVIKRYTLSGHVKDAKTGEDLIGAAIVIKGQASGAVTNVYGFYSLSLASSTYTLEFKYLGYQTVSKELNLSESNQKLDVSLQENELKSTSDVVIKAERAENHVQDVKMSSVKLDAAQIKKLPVLFGEVDVLKNIQTLPGVVSAGEGTTGFFVRGGSADQNLILLDEAPVYNASHILGFFSVFNSDALKSAELYKAGIPAEFGGRLSSLLDIRTKDGNNKKFSGSGGIGLIASRLTLEGPIQKEKSSWIVSARRTYADVFLLGSSNENTRNTKLYFYDINAKANFTLSDRDRLYVAGYFGRDVFKFGKQFGVNWGNATGTVRWNRIINSKLFSNTTGVFSNFDYGISSNVGVQGFEWTSNLKEITLKQDYSYFISPNNSLRFGVQGSYRSFQPGRVIPDASSILTNFIIPSLHSAEVATYISHELNVTKKWNVQYGLRFTSYANIGQGTEYSYRGEVVKQNITDTTQYTTGQPIKWFFGLEPRVSARYLIDEKSSIKLSYNRTYQYVHLLANSTSPLPFNVWMPSTRYIKPQIADQFAVGYFRNIFDNQFEFSVESFYKYFTRVTDFKDNAQILLNPTVETEVRQGTGNSYGLEFFLRKKEGRLTGWLSYTLMKATRTIPGVNSGKEYYADYDRRNTINLVTNYQINDKWDVSMAFTYGTGRPMTLPAGFFQYDYLNVPYYTERNGFKQPDFHRLDVSANYTKHPERKGYKSTWNFGVYNVYGRKNPFSVYATNVNDANGNAKSEKRIVMLWLFSIIPSATWNFNF